jgi:uncharacterized radical SAM superfamily Fe-S cluster-containing enzyme
MRQISSFRLWLEHTWEKNCQEHEAFRELPYSRQEYFRKFKYWLKREYRHQQKLK